MTPEEMNRAMEFIIQHQAHLSASLDREQATREESQRKLAVIQTQVVELTRIQSARLDRHDEVLEKHEKAQQEAQRRYEEFMHETRTWQQVWQQESRREPRDAQRRHEEALARLDRILDKLSDKPN
jgi:hypothetical protein